jgi:hypothetical protein
VVESMFFGFGVSSRIIGGLLRRVQGKALGAYEHPRLYRALCRARCWRRGWFGSAQPTDERSEPQVDRAYASGRCVAL